MDLANCPPELSDVPPELLAVVVAEAERDAERTAIFLNQLFLEWSRRHPEHGPPETYRGLFSNALLLELGAALRVLRWEQAGVIRPWMELPSSQTAMRSALLTCSELDSMRSLTNQMVQMFVDHFSWLAAGDQRADLVIEPSDEDWLADRIAGFLWSQRHLLDEQSDAQ